MKVGIFFTSITDWSLNPQKTNTMKNFGVGVEACGDEVFYYKQEGQKFHDLDAAVILGYSLGDSFRSRLIHKLRNRNIHTIFIDSDIFVYGKKDVGCYRYSVNGVYPNEGEYFCSLASDTTKLDKILNLHNLKVKPWRQNGTHILILGQRHTSWNMLGNNHTEWLLDIIKRIRQFTSRPIRVRLHPGDTSNRPKLIRILQENFDNTIQFSSHLTHQNISDDMIDAWCCVGYNSTPTCVSALNGIPIYLDAPLTSWATDVGFTDISQIENPITPDRTDWLHKIANIHHTNDEIVQGVYWSKFKNFYNFI